MTDQPPSLFRAEALQHYLEAENGQGVIQVAPPWTWAVLTIFVSGVLVALAISFLGHVEVNGRGRGIIRPGGGVRRLISQAGGTVGAIEVHPGQAVKAGTVLFHIEAPAIQSQMFEAEKQSASVQSDYRQIAAHQEEAYRQQSQQVKARIQQLREQIASYQDSVKIYERRHEARKKLFDLGLESAFDTDMALEDLATIHRQVSSAQQALNLALQEQAGLESRHQDDLWQRNQLMQTTETKREALNYLHGQTLVQAPEDGTVDALLVRPGEGIQANQVVGKLIPKGATLKVVAFLAEKDRAFVEPGQDVHLELDQLPYAEYGTLKGRITRISDDLASPAEIHEALGEEQKLDALSYRVELEITDRSALEAWKRQLRPGMLLDVRFALRRQRLIALVLDPLRRWFR
jgi:multidrug resistance efflux pump